MNKHEETERIIIDESNDILAIGETWLDKSLSDRDIMISCYSVLCGDKNRRGGGVLFYTQGNLKWQELDG